MFSTMDHDPSVGQEINLVDFDYHYFYFLKIIN